MTQDEFDKAPLLDQILYDTTGMLVENHPSIAEAMDKYYQAKLKLLGIADVVGSIDSMKKAMDSFKKELEAANEENPDDLFIKGANWGYNKAVEQFHNRFAKYYR